MQYKLNAQSLRLFGLHSDVNDAHRAGANRLQNKQTTLGVVAGGNAESKKMGVGLTRIIFLRSRFFAKGRTSNFSIAGDFHLN